MNKLDSVLKSLKSLQEEFNTYYNTCDSLRDSYFRCALNSCIHDLSCYIESPTRKSWEEHYRGLDAMYAQIDESRCAYPHPENPIEIKLDEIKKLLEKMVCSEKK